MQKSPRRGFWRWVGPRSLATNSCAVRARVDVDRLYDDAKVVVVVVVAFLSLITANKVSGKRERDG